jgi:pentatricopeptide repeat protein
MQKNNVLANETTYLSLLTACVELANVEKGEDLHRQLVSNNISLTVPLATVLISLYAKNGHLDKAIATFGEAQKLNKSDVLLWNSMIDAYGYHGKGDLALKLFNEMQELGLGIEDSTLVAVLNAGSHGGLYAEAIDIVWKTKEKMSIASFIPKQS